jgi:hypothetical protein
MKTKRSLLARLELLCTFRMVQKNSYLEERGGGGGGLVSAR